MKLLLVISCQKLKNKSFLLWQISRAAFFTVKQISPAEIFLVQKKYFLCIL